MFDYLQKFSQLPKKLRDKVSTPSIMADIEELEKKYNIDLAILIMKIMTKAVGIKDLTSYLAVEYELEKIKIDELIEEIKKKVFFGVADYLQFEAEKEEIAGREEHEDTPDLSSPEDGGAKFFFSAEDEEEIKELSKKTDSYSDFKFPSNLIDQKLDSISKEVGVNFGSQEMLDRFKQALKIYLRGIRNKIETKQVLAKSVDAGGLGLEEEEIERILKITDKADKDTPQIPTKKSAKTKLPEDKKDIGIGDAGYSFGKAKKLDTEHELAPPPPSLPLSPKLRRAKKLRQASPPYVRKNEQTKEEKLKFAESEAGQKLVDSELQIPAELESRKKKVDFKIPVEQTKEELKEETSDIDTVTEKEAKPIEETIVKPEAKPRQASQISGKKKIEDVKRVPKIMNPVDELHYMDLVNFRRLDEDPEKITAKIIDKIKLLEEDKYSQRIEGIKGWRQSPVNKLYLEIGQESISKGEPISAIIEGRKSSEQDFLTIKELEAIMDLNKSLRF